MSYVILNEKGERVASSTSHTFSHSLIAVLQRETGKKYRMEKESHNTATRRYDVPLLVEKPLKVAVRSTDLDSLREDLRCVMRNKHPNVPTYRIDWKGLKLINKLSDYDLQFLSEIGEDE